MPERQYGWRCPVCGVPMHVQDSRGLEDNTVRRRRECRVCGMRMTTYELGVTELEMLRDRAERYDAIRRTLNHG